MPRFTERQLGFIREQAEMIYSGAIGTLEDEMIDAARILDDVKYGSLPPSWEPDAHQSIFLWELCMAFEAFWQDLLVDPETTTDEVVDFADVRDLIISLRRSLLTLAH